MSSNQESSERSKIMSKWLAKFQTQQEEHILTFGLNKKHSYPLQGILSTGAVHPCINVVRAVLTVLMSTGSRIKGRHWVDQQMRSMLHKEVIFLFFPKEENSQ